MGGEMAAIVWDQVGDRLYEAGVSKGVLYQENRVGVPWNGLIAVEESVDDSVEPIYFDGVKFNDVVTLGDFSAIIRAYTYPEEFLPYEGSLEDQDGFYVSNQPKRRFGLSYQTEVGDDISGLGAGQKIHILYNLTAVPSAATFQTLGDEMEPIEFEWSVTSVPEPIANFRHTSHVVIDSRRMNSSLFFDIQTILYGDETNDPILPSLQSLSTFVRKWDRLIIFDNQDGTWTAEVRTPGILSMLDETTFQIISDSAEYIDADSYTIESSDKNEEDIWLP
jgi:hypothetical protein